MKKLLSKTLHPFLQSAFFGALQALSALSASAAGASKPCDVKISASQFQSWMNTYVPRGSNGRASAAAFYEVDSQGAVVREVFSKNAHKAQAVASTQKMITAYTAYREGGLGNSVVWNSEDRFYDSQGSAAIVYSTRKNPSLGQNVRTSDLLWTLMTHSSNGAALAISRGPTGSTRPFVEAMNEYSRDLIGRDTANFDTYFHNPAGLTDNADRYEFGNAGETQRSTADNMARLTARIMGDSGFRSTMKKYGLSNFSGGTVTKGGSTQAAGRTLIAYLPLPGCSSKALAYAVFGEGTSEQWTRIGQMHSQILKALGY
jgi:D-alanyl-D-alanine carboxypeptidase